MTLRNGIAFFLLTFAAGCGGSDSDKFIGPWTYASGATTTVACTGQAPVMAPLKASVRVDEGASSDQVIFNTETSCALKLSVSGKVATLVGAQTCPVIVGGNKIDANLASGTVTFGDETLQIKLNGTVSSGGQSCTYTVDGTAARVTGR